MFINGRHLSHYGGKLQSAFVYGGVPLENTYFQGKNHSAYVLQSQVIGLKTLTLTIVVSGRDHRDVVRRKSALDAAFLGQIELLLGDGWGYTCHCDELGKETRVGETEIEAEYLFSGIRHGEWISTAGKVVYNPGTLPRSDCTLSVTVQTPAALYPVGSVTFQNAEVGEKFVVDGIHKRILVDGVPAAQRASWTEFPYLVPGRNGIECLDVPQVEFWPCYL